MPQFAIRLEAASCPNPFGGPALPAIAEAFTVEAADRRAAYRMVPAKMQSRLMGQTLHIYVDGVEELAA